MARVTSNRGSVETFLIFLFLIAQTDPELLEEKEKFASEKQFFDEQRAAMENERRQLTDAAIKLGHEVTFQASK